MILILCRVELLRSEQTSLLVYECVMFPVWYKRGKEEESSNAARGRGTPSRSIILETAIEGIYVLYKYKQPPVPLFFLLLLFLLLLLRTFFCSVGLRVLLLIVLGIVVTARFLILVMEHTREFYNCPANRPNPLILLLFRVGIHKENILSRGNLKAVSMERGASVWGEGGGGEDCAVSEIVDDVHDEKRKDDGKLN